MTFTTLGTALTLLLLACVLIGEPWWGLVSHRRMLAELEAGDRRARTRLYQRWTAGLWALALSALVLAALEPGFGLDRLGLRMPDRFDLRGIGIPTYAATAVAIALLAGALAGGLLQFWTIGRTKTIPPPVVAGGERVLALLPRTPREGVGFAVLAVSAGITEEIVWRGFLIAALVALLPPLPMLAYLAASAAAFGMAHLYQGPAGMLVTTLVGALLALLYLATGSLLLPIAFHVLLDLRALLIRQPAPANPPAT